MNNISTSSGLKCYHQMAQSKFNFNIVYSPPYQCLIWDYKKDNVDCIRKYLNSVDWDFVQSCKNVHQQAQYLNEILMSVFLTIYQVSGS